MITLYGIPNCDTVKKARQWLETNNIEFQFHDFRKQGLPASKVSEWLEHAGAETVINKRSATWKQLSDADKEAVAEGDAAEVAAQNPTLIKRPVIEGAKKLELGFKPELYAALFS